MKTKKTKPAISLIIPVKNSPELIRSCIEFIRASDYDDYEIIVIDDASTDNTLEVVRSLDVNVLELAECKGPANARNKGVELAKSDIVFFLDADVRVHEDTIRLMVQTFKEHPEIDAAFGSYDSEPGVHNIISQYKNLFHHFVHQESREDATTFWSGCGAIRKEIFLKYGGFDVNYNRPCIEDIELGTRLYKNDHKIKLNKKVQVTHQKYWSFWGMLKADVKDRGIPWTQLILREKRIPNDLNLTIRQRISALLAFGIIGMLGMQALEHPILFLLPFVSLALILLIDHYTVRRRVPTILRALGVAGSLAGIFAIFYYGIIWLIIALVLFVGIIILNFRFYSFFSREKYFLFAVVVIPLHIFYYIYSVFSFIIGILTFLFKPGAPIVTRVKRLAVLVKGG